MIFLEKLSGQTNRLRAQLESARSSFMRDGGWTQSKTTRGLMLSKVSHDATKSTNNNKDSTNMAQRSMRVSASVQTLAPLANVTRTAVVAVTVGLAFWTTPTRNHHDECREKHASYNNNSRERRGPHFGICNDDNNLRDKRRSLRNRL
jgi:hypothetical protein